jgi:hypothetical protein
VSYLITIPDPVPDRFGVGAFKISTHSIREFFWTYYAGPISHAEVCRLHGTTPLHGPNSGAVWERDWRCDERIAALGGGNEQEFRCTGRATTESMRRWLTENAGALYATMHEALEALVSIERIRVAGAGHDLASARQWLVEAEALLKVTT